MNVSGTTTGGKNWNVDVQGLSELGGILGGGQGGGKGGGGSQGSGKNFLSDIANAEKNVWTSYINSTNLQHQSTLPTQASPVPQSTAPAQQPVVVQTPAAAQQKPATEQPVAEPSSPAADPAFNGYVEASQQANEEKKKDEEKQNNKANKAKQNTPAVL